MGRYVFDGTLGEQVRERAREQAGDDGDCVAGRLCYAVPMPPERKPPSAVWKLLNASAPGLRGARLGYGKLRRMNLSSSPRPEPVGRTGECGRCGLCCRILFNCPLLTTDADGLPSCSGYARRPGVCRGFPYDQRDVDDIAAMDADATCTYQFTDEG